MTKIYLTETPPPPPPPPREKDASDYVNEAIKKHMGETYGLVIERKTEIDKFDKWITTTLLKEEFDGKVFKNKYSMKECPKHTIDEMEKYLHTKLKSLTNTKTRLFAKCKLDHSAHKNLVIEVGYERLRLMDNTENKKKPLPATKRVCTMEEAYPDWKLDE